MKPLEQVDTLISGGIVVTMDERGTIYEDGAVAVRGSDIVLVGPSETVENRVSAKNVVNATNCVIMPGLVNAHTHAAMTIFRGLADDIPLKPWLEKIWPLEMKYADAENVSLGTELAFAEMISSGTTTCADMYWHFHEAAETAKRVGFRFFAGMTALDALDGETTDSLKLRLRQFIQEYDHDSLVVPCVQVHATYTVSRETLQIVKEAAEEYGVVFVTHAAESKQELKDVQERHGMSPIGVLESLNMLGPRTLLAHGVHLTNEEISLIAARGASIVHNPSSNLKLGSGIARVADLVAGGVNVALGTDGAASNNDLNMWEEMRLAALLQKGITYDPTVMPAEKVLEIATIGGARALNLQDKIGSLETGKKADLIQVDLSSLNLTPMYDVVSHLVYAANASDVCMTMINGQIVYQDGELLTIDAQDVKQRVRDLSRKMRSGEQAA